MGERRLLEVVTMEELIEMKYFNSVTEIYNTPDEILPRVRRAGKIVRPLRFYLKDVERLFAMDKGTPSSRVSSEIQPKPVISFKRRRR